MKLATALLSLLLAAAPAWATDLRGRIDGYHPYAAQPFPMNGVRVDLWMMTPMGWQQVFATFTGPDGMYYLQNIMPGQYTLQVNGAMNYPIVVAPMDYQDLPPILLGH